METAESKSPTTQNSASSSVSEDVLHLGSPTKLSDEDIAKAIAHHNRHHSGDQPQQAAAKNAQGKKRR
ncbi:MAG TPA: hypothetical protein VFC37_22960 [Terracidiphilus sp.]|nr:hypothetical protein [Terracidiphilus sp.]